MSCSSASSIAPRAVSNDVTSWPFERRACAIRSPEASETSRSAEVPPISTVIFMIWKNVRGVQGGQGTPPHTRARSVGESARGAAFETPARARGRRQPTGKPTLIGVGGAREANEISARNGAPDACLERARRAHHQMRDVTVAGDVDLAQLECEQSVFVRLHTQRRVHLRTARTRDAGEDSTPSELLTDDLRDRRVGGLRKSYLGARLPARDSRVALP